MSVCVCVCVCVCVSQGSGSNVDICIITADKTEYIRPYDIANKKGERYVNDLLNLPLVLAYPANTVQSSVRCVE